MDDHLERSFLFPGGGVVSRSFPVGMVWMIGLKTFAPTIRTHTVPNEKSWKIMSTNHKFKNAQSSQSTSSNLQQHLFKHVLTWNAKKTWFHPSPCVFWSLGFPVWKLDRLCPSAGRRWLHPHLQHPKNRQNLSWSTKNLTSTNPFFLWWSFDIRKKQTHFDAV